jgi:hypothetical protein
MKHPYMNIHEEKGKNHMWTYVKKRKNPYMNIHEEKGKIHMWTYVKKKRKTCEENRKRRHT